LVIADGRTKVERDDFVTPPSQDLRLLVLTTFVNKGEDKLSKAKPPPAPFHTEPIHFIEVQLHHIRL
jgi:hypothetical protein